MLELHGDIAPADRVRIIQRFKASTRDGPRVLLMSGVGVLGLNIPYANILIKVVRDPSSLPCWFIQIPFQTHNWSVKDDEQLIGRIYRYPQSKTVHIYNLIADHTQDVFSNHIAFTKGVVADSFTNMTPSMRT